MTDPLTLTIVSMIIGMVLGACACVIAVMICIDLGRLTVVDLTPSDEDMDQMCIWYDTEYGKDDFND